MLEMDRIRWIVEPRWRKPGRKGLRQPALSYFVTICGFAVAYTFLSHSDPRAFTCGALSLFEALYFSLVTAATVGYGDIIPKSASARGLVMLEIGANLVYVVFFFSVLATVARERPNRALISAQQRVAPWWRRRKLCDSLQIRSLS